MLESFFWGVACVICCFVGAYLYCEHDYKMWSILSMILGVIMLFITIFSATFNGIDAVSKTYDEIIEEKNAQIELYYNNTYSDPIEVQTISGCLTHKAAEIGVCEQLPNGNWSIPFYVEENQTQIYLWEDEEPYEDVPYLVVLDNMGTLNDPTDDVLVTVWACVK